MKTQILSKFFILCALTLCEICGQRTTGKLFLLGGATRDSSSSIYDKLRQATNQVLPKIAVVISAAPSLNDGLEAYYVDDSESSVSYENLFIRYGFEPSVLQLAIDNYQLANSNETELGRENIEKIQNADAVFFNGGDQSRHSRAWLNDDGTDTEIMTVLRNKFSSGTVIAGTSAGMAVQPEYTFGSGRSYGYYYYNADLKFCNIGEEFADDRDANDTYRYDENGAYLKGFGFLTDALVDTHFDARGRFVRLIAAMRHIGFKHGFGVDEDTGLYIEDDTASVYGSWGVWVIDSTTASTPEGAAYFSAENIRMHYLTEGDSYNLTSGIVSSTKSSIIEEENSLEFNDNIFGSDQALRSFKSLISSDSTIFEGYSREEDPRCVVVFEKDEKTMGYLSDQEYTVENLLLHVRTNGSDSNPDPSPDPITDPSPDPITDPSPDPITDPSPDPITDPSTDDPNSARMLTINHEILKIAIFFSVFKLVHLM